MPFKNKEEYNEYQREWQKRRYNTNAKHRENVKTKARAQQRKNKLLVLDVYGCSRCACCGERDSRFLTIDHIVPCGRAGRGQRLGTALYRWLITNNFPEGFQVLCWNCNCGRAVNGGICPHHDTAERSQHD